MVPCSEVTGGTRSLAPWSSGRDAETFPWDEARSEGTLRRMAALFRERGHGTIPDERVVPLNTACATGNQAIALAAQWIRRGLCERVVAGGVDARCTDSNFLNFHMLGAVTTAEVPSAEASRP